MNKVSEEEEKNPQRRRRAESCCRTSSSSSSSWWWWWWWWWWWCWWFDPQSSVYFLPVVPPEEVMCLWCQWTVKSRKTTLCRPGSGLYPETQTSWFKHKVKWTLNVGTTHLIGWNVSSGEWSVVRRFLLLEKLHQLKYKNSKQKNTKINVLLVEEEVGSLIGGLQTVIHLSVTQEMKRNGAPPQITCSV